MLRLLGLTVFTAILCVAGGITDNFESYALGSFPAPVWSDVGAVFNNGQILPSATVVKTLDAFGNPTQAMAIRDQVSSSRGIYAPTALSRFYSLAADIRVDRYATNSQAPPSDWAMQLTFAHNGVSSYDGTPQAGIYAASLTHTWRLFLIGEVSLGLDQDLGIAATPGTWYRVQLDADALTGQFHSRITDILTNTLLVDNVTTVAGWTPNEARWDSIAFFGAELTGSPANLSVVDNVNISSHGTIPEPSTLLLVGGAAMPLLYSVRRRKARDSR